MPRARDPNRDKAFEIWKEHNGNITNRKLAEMLGVPEKTLSGWKSKDKWNQKTNGVLQTNKRSTPIKKESKKPVVESDELTEKQRLFCIYYIKYFNATKAYQKAYECAYTTAMTNGHGLLRNTKISIEIDRMKSEQATELKLDVKDIIQKYIDIAFADITDYLKFGREEEIVYNEFGQPELDANSKVKMQAYNYVHLNDSSEIDGTILTEVKQGRDGITVKLADKMKALEMLAKYTDLLSERELHKMQTEKVKADAEFAKERAAKLKGQKKDTSLLDALVEGRKQYEQEGH
jgi:phage terminase small subunit